MPRGCRRRRGSCSPVGRPGSRDTALTGCVAGVGPVAERVAGGRPGAEGGVLEVLDDGAGRRGVAGRVVGGEGRAVEVADEVLTARTAGDAAGIQVDDHHPLDVAAGCRRPPAGTGRGTPRLRPTAPVGPNSLRCVQVFRSGDP